MLPKPTKDQIITKLVWLKKINSQIWSHNETKQNKLIINLKTNVNFITTQELWRQEPTLVYTTQDNKDVLMIKYL